MRFLITFVLLLLSLTTPTHAQRVLTVDQFTTTDFSTIWYPPTVSGTLATVSGTETFTNKTVSGPLTFVQTTTPVSPASGETAIYAKSDGFFYYLNATGAEQQIGSGGGGGGTGTVSAVTGTSPIVITGTASEPNVTLTSGGVASGTYTKVGVNEFGLISSGTSLVESDIPSLQTTKITSGIFGIAFGGTGLGSVGASGTVLTSNGTDLVYVASNDGIVESVSATSPLSITGTVSNPIVTFSGTLPVSNGGTGLSATGASGSVLTSNASGTTEWLQPEQKENINFLTNASFETGNLTGWTSTGTAPTVSAYSNPIKGNAFVSLFSSGTTSLCQVAAVPSGNAGQTIEVGGFYKYLSNSGLPPVSYPIRVSATLNTGAVVSQTFLYEASAVDTQLYRPVPKMFIATTSQTTTATLCAEAPNGTTVTGAFAGEGLPWFDRMYLGTVKSLINGAIVEGESACVGVSEQGFTGTNASYVCSRVGDKLKIRGFFRVGTPTASLAAINLPSGLNIDVSKQGITTTQIFGHWARGIDGTSVTMAGNTTGPRFMFVKNTDKTKVYFASIINAAGGASPSSLLQDVAGNTITAANDQITFSLEVPIEGWQGSGTTYNSTCPNDIACENVFSAKVTAAGAVVSGENLDWINGNGSMNGQTTSFQFNPNIFTVGPNCSASGGGTTGTAISLTSSSSATALVIRGFGTTTGNAGGSDYHVVCQKAAPDYKPKQEVKGYLNQTVQTGGLFGFKMVTVTFGGGTEVTQCAATPCVIHRQSGEVSSVSRSAGGTYAINFNAGTFTVAPNCHITGNATTSRGVMISVVSRTNLAYNITTREDSNLAQDIYGDVTCFGY